VKFRLSSSRAQVTQAPAAAKSDSVNSLSGLYPSQQLQLYPEQSIAQIANSPRLTRFADIDDIYISATSQKEIPSVIRQITQILRERHRLLPGDPDDFRIRDLTEMGETIAATSRLMASLLLTVATISLIVGGVGIMNIMLVSVTERTREIGLRMAVGARSKDILRQFLIEAIFLCLAGGLVGILLGRATSIIITKFLHWPTLTSLPAMLAALIVSISVGILFGYYPAYRASKLDPIEALRAE
jgi:ABC-type antimicrobial peptide transport system permease subunit